MGAVEEEAFLAGVLAAETISGLNPRPGSARDLLIVGTPAQEFIWEGGIRERKNCPGHKQHE